MSKKPNFQTQTLQAFMKIRSETQSDSSEYEVRVKIIKYLVEGLLSYGGKDYRAEKDKTDIKLLDETHNLVLAIIETKNPNVKEAASSFIILLTKVMQAET